MDGYTMGITGMAVTPEGLYVTPVKLNKYVRNASEILDTCRHHGIVETDGADFVISCDRPIDPGKFARAAAIFRDAINTFFAEKDEATYGPE
jgi:hypothetical protein